MYRNATVFLKIYSVNKKVKPTIPRYILKIENTLMQKASNVACWVIQKMMDILWCKGRHEQLYKKTFVI